LVGFQGGDGCFVAKSFEDRLGTAEDTLGGLQGSEFGWSWSVLEAWNRRDWERVGGLKHTGSFGLNSCNLSCLRVIYLSAFDFREMSNTHKFWFVEDRSVIEILLGYG
jgi:hypothetical protein